MHNCEFKYLFHRSSGRMSCTVVRPEVSRYTHIYACTYTHIQRERDVHVRINMNTKVVQRQVSASFQFFGFVCQTNLHICAQFYTCDLTGLTAKCRCASICYIQSWYGVATINRIYKKIGLFAEYRSLL